MATRRGERTRSRATKSLTPKAKRGANFQPHEEAIKRTLAKNRYYRSAPLASERSTTARRASGN